MEYIKARFLGQNSLGYTTGKIYTLRVEPRENLIWILDKHRVGKPCPYTSMASFLKNWQPESHQFKKWKK